MKRNWEPAFEKVCDEGRCRNCHSGANLDPAHVIPRSRGADNDPLGVIPLCRICHSAYDSGRLDILPVLTIPEQTYAVSLVGIAEAYRRTTAESPDSA